MSRAKKISFSVEAIREYIEKSLDGGEDYFYIGTNDRNSIKFFSRVHLAKQCKDWYLVLVTSEEDLDLLAKDIHHCFDTSEYLS